MATGSAGAAGLGGERGCPTGCAGVAGSSPTSTGQPSHRARRQTTTQAAAGSTARSMDRGHHVRMSAWRVLGVDACKVGGSGSPRRKGRSAPTPRQESVILSRTLAAAACWQLSRSTSRSACPTRDADSYADHTDGRRADCPVLGVIPLGMRRLSGHPGGLARASRAFRFCFNRAFRPWFRCLALAKVSHRQLAGMGIAGSCCRSRLPFGAWTG